MITPSLVSSLMDGGKVQRQRVGGAGEMWGRLSMTRAEDAHGRKCLKELDRGDNVSSRGSREVEESRGLMSRAK